MKKNTLILTFLSIILFSKIASAQTVQDAVKFIYYERYTSAQQILQKLIASNPADVNAQYWLGQTMLNQDDLASAKDIYQKALTTTNNAPLILVGMGHIELLQGKPTDARQRFETAINLTKGKKENKYGNSDVLKAIGRANADGDSKIGDPNYGVEKLTQVAEIDQTDPDIYVNMGILNLKRGSDYGGQAISSFDNALTRNTKYAKAIYRKARVYITQNNAAIFLPLLEQAVAADPTYAPAYFALYDYYKNKDVNKAKTYLESYIANSDKDCKASFFYADYLFRAAKYQESLDKTKELENSDCAKKPRINVLFAYNYDRLNDSISAKNRMQQFISKEDSSKIMPSDYEFLGKIISKFPGSENEAITYFIKAVNKDTTLANKLIYLHNINNLLKKNKNYSDLLKYAQMSYSINVKPSNVDIYNLGEAAYLASNYTLADSMFTIYKNKYPTQKFGYYWRVRVAQAADSTMSKGLLVNPVQEYIQFLEQNKDANKTTLIEQYGLLAAYYANVAKDKAKAIEALGKILEYDPQNADAKKYIELLNKTATKPKKP